MEVISKTEKVTTDLLCKLQNRELNVSYVREGGRMPEAIHACVAIAGVEGELPMYINSTYVPSSGQKLTSLDGPRGIGEYTVFIALLEAALIEIAIGIAAEITELVVAV